MHSSQVRLLGERCQGQLDSCVQSNDCLQSPYISTCQFYNRTDYSSSPDEDDYEVQSYNPRLSEPINIENDHFVTKASRAKTLPKSLSLPLNPADLPDPFPELSFSPVSSLGSSTILTRPPSKSSPASPVPDRRKDEGQVQQRASRGSVGAQWARELQLRSHSQESPGSNEHCQNYNYDLRMWRPTGYVKTMLHFYNYDDNSSRVTSINENMTSWDVCQQLMVKYHAAEDRNWTITEHIPKFNLERNLEDHEIVYHIYRSWGNTEDNKFYFKKDFRKYELFQNPRQFFPSHLIDSKSLRGSSPEILCTGEERYKNILLQLLFDSCTPPDIQGYLSMKEGKKSWKKYFCVLRSSGLYYSSKGTSKDPRHLVLFSHLTDVNIYFANNAKKQFGAPNNYCICLKAPYYVSDAKELKLLCAEDDQARLCWVTGMRLVKYGTQLRDNYKGSTSYSEQLRGIEDDSPYSNLEESSAGTARVAMDFTGPGGRVVEDPNEAQAVAIAEVHHWRKKATLRKCGSSPLSQSPKAGVTVAENPNYQPHSVMSYLHLAQPWYHRGVSREEAVEVINQHGAVDGVFLVRESHSIPGAYVLSLAHNYKVKHCQIGQLVSEGQLYYSLDGGLTKFSDLLQLVEFYQLNSGGLPTQLTHYVSRL